MAERKDNYKGKHRKLNPGEYQGKDGRYVYYYKDATGKQCKVYSWTLYDTDEPPKGKKAGKSLKTLEKEIAEKIREGVIDTRKSDKMTVSEAFYSWLDTKTEIRETTRKDYRYHYELHIKPYIGHLKLCEVTEDVIEKMYAEMVKKKLSLGSRKTIMSKINPVFAKLSSGRSKVILYNPCESVMQSIRYSGGNRNALTKSQQDGFLNWVKSIPEYESLYNTLMILIYGGCRVSELLGLRWQDIDFENRKIMITHQMRYTEVYDDDGVIRCRKMILPTKNRTSCRCADMYDPVYYALVAERERQKKAGISNTEQISGYYRQWKSANDNDYIDIDVTMTDFIFIGDKGKVRVATVLNEWWNKLTAEYNEYEKKLAEQENRPAIEMPHFSTHCLRHTFITRAFEAGCTPDYVAIQSGHNGTRTTMTIYNHIQEERRKSEADKINSLFSSHN